MADQRTANESPDSKQLTSPSLPRPLRLKVIGTARHGQMVEIFSTRLTIGSAPQCTLRLRAAGVGPLQCLIIREPSGPVVRSLSVDTLLNGERFREEPLHSGDRLQVGSIELELCDDARSIVAPPTDSIRPRSIRRASARPESSSWMEPNAERPLEVLSRIERLEEGLNQLRDVEKTASTPPASDQHEEHPSAQVPTESAATSPTEVTQESREAAEEREQIKAELQRANEHHEHARAEFARLQNERDALQSRCDDLERKQGAAEEWLRKLEGDLEHQMRASKEAFDCQMQQRTAAAEVAQQFHDVVEKLVDQQAQANHALTHLDQLLTTERQGRCELERRLEQQSALVSEVQAQCQSLQASVELLRTAPPTAETTAKTREDQTDPSPVNPAESADVADTSRRRQQRDWLAQQVASVEQCHVATPDHGTTQSHPIPITRPSVAECQEPAGRTEESAFPGCSETRNFTADADVEDAAVVQSDLDPTGEVISRLSRAGIWKVSEECEPSNERSFTRQSPTRAYETSDVDALSDHEHLLGTVTNAPETEAIEGDLADRETRVNEPSDAAAGSGGDDAIEAYMQRLLQRVRGDSATQPAVPVSTFVPEIVRTPRTEVAIEVNESATPPASTVLTESEYQPRSQAPEMGVNLAAMRAIGNDNRRKDIMKHAQRTWTDKTRTRLFGSVSGLSIAFASFFYLDTHTEYAAIGMCVGFAIAGYWTLQALRCRKQLSESIRLNAEAVQAAEASAEQPVEAETTPSETPSV